MALLCWITNTFSSRWRHGTIKGWWRLSKAQPLSLLSRGRDRFIERRGSDRVPESPYEVPISIQVLCGRPVGGPDVRRKRGLNGCLNGALALQRQAVDMELRVWSRRRMGRDSTASLHTTMIGGHDLTGDPDLLWEATFVQFSTFQPGEEERVALSCRDRSAGVRGRFSDGVS